MFEIFQSFFAKSEYDNLCALQIDMQRFEQQVLLWINFFDNIATKYNVDVKNAEKKISQLYDQ